MPLYTLRDNSITPLPSTSFRAEQVYERADLQRLLRDQIEILFPDERAMVLAEEFGDWEDSRRRIDLLCLDGDANLVVVELKRTESGGHMELQGLRYAAMVSTMTFDQAAQAHAHYLNQRSKADKNPEHQARKAILSFLGWEEPQDDGFAANVRILLASQDFHRELTTTVMWLLERDIDIRCVRLTPYKLDDDQIVLNVEQVIPLPEAAEYQIRVREKRQLERAERSRLGRSKIDLTLGEQSWTRLTKREAMLRTILHLFNSGISPEQIADTIPWRKRNQFLIHAEGTLNAQEFCTAAAGLIPDTRRTFRPELWYCENKQLMHYRGKTWALVKRWGQRTPEALRNLMDLANEKGVENASKMAFEVHES